MYKKNDTQLKHKNTGFTQRIKGAGEGVWQARADCGTRHNAALGVMAMVMKRLGEEKIVAKQRS